MVSACNWNVEIELTIDLSEFLYEMRKWLKQICNKNKQLLNDECVVDVDSTSHFVVLESCWKCFCPDWLSGVHELEWEMTNVSCQLEMISI